MTTLEPKAGERVMDVRVTDDTISVDLYDGRTIMVPLAWYPRLLHATPVQRANWHMPEQDTESTGQMLMRNSRRKVFCRVPRLLV